jgi:hypothetical protein
MVLTDPNTIFTYSDSGNTAYAELTTNLLNMSTSISGALENVDSTQPLYDFLSKAQTDICNSLTDINTIQINNLDFLDNYKDFAAQNVVNQELTKMYAENQKTNVNVMSGAVQQDNDNKLRMIEINNYYIQKNEHINAVMKRVLTGLAVLLILVILSKTELIPTGVATFFGVIIVLAILGYGVYVAYDLSQRDKFNFDQYVIPFDLTAKIKEASGNLLNIGQELRTELHPFITGAKGLENVVGCIGESCCSTGTKYDVTKEQCVKLSDLQCSGGTTFNVVNNKCE